MWGGENGRIDIAGRKYALRAELVEFAVGYCGERKSLIDTRNAEEWDRVIFIL